MRQAESLTYYGTPRPNVDPRPQRRHCETALVLRAPRRAARDGRGCRSCDRKAEPSGRRGRHGRGQELCLPGAGDSGRGRAQGEGRGLDAYDRPSGAACRQGHPVSALGHGAGVLGGSGQRAVELHQLAAPGCCASAAVRTVRRQKRYRPVERNRGMGQANQGRQPRRSRLSTLSHRVGGHSERRWQLPGQTMPAPRGVLLLRGAAASTQRQHPDREPRPVRHRSGPA